MGLGVTVLSSTRQCFISFVFGRQGLRIGACVVNASRVNAQYGAPHNAQFMFLVDDAQSARMRFHGFAPLHLFAHSSWCVYVCWRYICRWPQLLPSVKSLRYTLRCHWNWRLHISRTLRYLNRLINEHASYYNARIQNDSVEGNPSVSHGGVRAEGPALGYRGKEISINETGRVHNKCALYPVGSREV